MIFTNGQKKTMCKWMHWSTENRTNEKQWPDVPYFYAKQHETSTEKHLVQSKYKEIVGYNRYILMPTTIELY